MPFTRIIAILYFIVLTILATIGIENHPWFTTETLWIAVLCSIVLVLMSFRRSFFLDIVVYFLTSFFMLRIIVLYFAPESLDYQNYLHYEKADCMNSMLYILAIETAVLFGNLLVPVKRKGTHAAHLRDDLIFGRKVNEDAFFRIYAYCALISVSMQIILSMTTGAGMRGVAYDRGYGVIYRLSYFMLSLSFISFIALRSDNTSKKNRRLFVIILILLAFHSIFLNTSKGALFYILIAFILVSYFMGKKIPSSFVVAAFIAGAVSIFLYGPVIALARLGLITESKSTFSVLQLLIYVKDNFTINVSDAFLFFSQRMGGYDWLTAFLHVGQDAFPSWVGFPSELVTIINSPGHLFGLGDIIVRPDFIEVEHMIPHVMRGWSLENVGEHAELMGIAGMSFLYFGYIGGPIFFLLWSFITEIITLSRANYIIKILYYNTFVILYCLGGSFVTSFSKFYEGILTMLFVFMVYHFNRLIIKQRHRPDAIDAVSIIHEI